MVLCRWAKLCCLDELYDSWSLYSTIWKMTVARKISMTVVEGYRGQKVADVQSTISVVMDFGIPRSSTLVNSR